MFIIEVRLNEEEREGGMHEDEEWLELVQSFTRKFEILLYVFFCLFLTKRSQLVEPGAGGEGSGLIYDSPFAL